MAQARFIVLSEHRTCWWRSWRKGIEVCVGKWHYSGPFTTISHLFLLHKQKSRLSPEPKFQGCRNIKEFPRD
jgi:hypothetical protein